jgi:hypothetical protein
MAELAGGPTGEILTNLKGHIQKLFGLLVLLKTHLGGQASNRDLEQVFQREFGLALRLRDSSSSPVEQAGPA